MNHLNVTREVNRFRYAVATTSRLLKIIGLFCKISSLLQGSFAKETYNFIDFTNRSHPRCVWLSSTKMQHPKIHQFDKLRSPGVSRYKFNWNFGLIWIYIKELDFLDAVDFEGVAFSVEIATHNVKVKKDMCVKEYIRTYFYIHVFKYLSRVRRTGSELYTNVEEGKEVEEGKICICAM